MFNEIEQLNSFFYLGIAIKLNHSVIHERVLSPSIHPHSSLFSSGDADGNVFHFKINFERIYDALRVIPID